MLSSDLAESLHPWAFEAWRAHNEEMRRFDEAAALRRVAAGIARYDPSFASDLFAAADRHIGSR